MVFIFGCNCFDEYLVMNHNRALTGVNVPTSSQLALFSNTGAVGLSENQAKRAFISIRIHLQILQSLASYLLHLQLAFYHGDPILISFISTKL